MPGPPSWFLLFLAILATGCSEPHGLPIATIDSIEHDLCDETPQVIHVEIGGHRTRVQQSASGGGTFVDFTPVNRLADLERVELTLTWNSQAPLTEGLRVEAWLYEGPVFEHPYAQGISPLAWDLEVRDLEFRESPGFSIGPTDNNAFPVWVSATVPSQPATLTLVEFYRCNQA